ncbi:acetyl esterase/lipase [Pontibacter ummariensis]|uniref:Acetyl esterase/lipase n=1 Tax=Pontibacter ummariensis TaxID=1610492 RepID=A0A239IBW9_9BACT|nr:alpha/beta hydrolase [Pontibacter ummariensis]PRY09986.1 acetyl esterase/lipase [Pontibacter ummariensis]SNS89904.1 Acetyl esterase/lipase [Pontibacter ummariensis]
MKNKLTQNTQGLPCSKTCISKAGRGAYLFGLLCMVTFLLGCSNIQGVGDEQSTTDPILMGNDGTTQIVEVPTDAAKIEPNGPNPSWAPSIDPQMLAVIEQFQSYGIVPYPKLAADQAREEPTFYDALADLLREYNISPKPASVKVNHRVIPNETNQNLLVRIYTPKTGTGPFPVIVYYHGGGWVIANLDTYEPSASALADKAGAIVMSVAYRQAPEHQYPAAHEDAFAAYQWARDSASVINGNPEMVVTAGESAGGNMAVAVALMAKERNVKMPEHILSVYPIADGDVDSPTYQEYVNAFFLNKTLMKWFFSLYAPGWETQTHPLIELVNADLNGLPPTTIINAEIDPLRYEGQLLAERLQAAGVPVERKVYEGVTHEFFGMNALLEEAVAAQDYAASRLKNVFKQ